MKWLRTLVLTAAMVVSMTGASSLFATGSTPAGGEVIAFAPLASEVERRTVPAGTALEDLARPNASTAAIKAAQDAAKRNGREKNGNYTVQKGDGAIYTR